MDEQGEIDLMGYKFGNVPTYMVLRVRGSSRLCVWCRSAGLAHRGAR